MTVIWIQVMDVTLHACWKQVGHVRLRHAVVRLVTVHVEMAFALILRSVTIPTWFMATVARLSVKWNVVTFAQGVSSNRIQTLVLLYVVMGCSPGWRHAMMATQQTEMDAVALALSKTGTRAQAMTAAYQSAARHVAMDTGLAKSSVMMGMTCRTTDALISVRLNVVMHVPVEAL